MALLQISEPGQSPEPHASDKKRAVGIDLGTTNSLVAAIADSGAQVLLDSEARALLPSVVRYHNDGIEVGYAAKLAASADPLNTVVSVKRLMGRSLSDVQSSSDQHKVFSYQFSTRNDGVPAIETVLGPKTPVEVSADILVQLAQRAETALGGPLEGAVITVPAYFDDAQRQATKDAARVAGVRVLRLLNEPTAAAVAYGLDQHEDSTIAVYDLGGGTFDISILRLSKGVFEVLATGGDSALGGDDFDQAIMAWLITALDITTTLEPSQERQLLNSACELKEALSAHEKHTIEYQQRTVTLSREQLYLLIDPLIQRTIRACKRALRDAGIDKTRIDNVVMVGGSTRGLRVREKVEEFFAQPPLVALDPDRVVAIGAAIQADVLIGNKPDTDMLLLDVLPLSLGLETMGGLVEKVIHRNTTIPVVKAQEFTTFKDGQTAMSIHVIQGEREMVSDCRSLARFELQGIPPMVAGAAHIRVIFQVDADGLLNVSAEEKSTGVAASVVVKPSYGLSDESITEMLSASFEHAQSDIQLRALREQQVEAQRVIETLQSALDADGQDLLSVTEYQQIEDAVNVLASLAQQQDTDAIKQQVDRVSALSEEFAARRMNASIHKALTGHTLDELDGLSK